ncbi:MAG: 23S rRNA (uracil(1939)-C(5))-methyltransferase RlmD [Parashewanella sp.]
MAQFFQPKTNKNKKMSPKINLNVSHLDHLGAGVARHNGKVVFISGALPEEEVSAQLIEQKKNFAKAKLLKVVQPSAERTKPVCQHYGSCGGCDLQHASIDVQHKHKLAALQEQVSKSIPLTDVEVSSLVGESWHYRRRAKLATSFDQSSHKLQLGFRKLNSKAVAEIEHCPILDKSLLPVMEQLSACLNQLKAKKTLGHIELISAEHGPFVVVRITKKLNATDKSTLEDFASKYQVNLLLQNNDGQFESLHGDEHIPSYLVTIPDQQSLELSFNIGSFVQVNADINNKMVVQAMQWLAPKQGETIIDLFCGMGNFSLPIAQAGANVIGVEGIDSAVEQARYNAKQNGIENTEFYSCDLSGDLSRQPWLIKADKLLLDPARAGAFDCLQHLEKLDPKKVVYVSCNPASLARDTSVLISHGYQLQKLSMIDMFPQTHHIEAMALFVKK